MDKESVFELQKIDCNCNDCKFMDRNFEKYKESLESHKELQYNYYIICRNKYGDKTEFQFNRNEAMINYGRCSKLNKDVSFIPNICQIETQNCFKHRKEQ